jgi:DNA-binding transcriptional MerR regulator
MLTIGAFARLGGVSVRALRHYETVGVLAPATVDPQTGYRYYRAAQLERLHRIQALQDLGLSLQQLLPVLDGGVTVEQLSGMLALKRAELADRVAEDQARLARVEQRLRYIELEDDMSLDFVIKPIPAVRVAQIRYRGEEGLDFATLADFVIEAGPMLHDGLRAASVEPEGPTLLHYEERPDNTLTPIVAVPIGNQPLAALAAIEAAELPAIDAVVTILRGPGGHDLIGPVYGEMGKYAEDHGYEVRGPGRDHIVDRDGGRDDIVFELQLPVSRASG